MNASRGVRWKLQLLNKPRKRNWVRTDNGVLFLSGEKTFTQLAVPMSGKVKLVHHDLAVVR